MGKEAPQPGSGMSDADLLWWSDLSMFLLVNWWVFRKKKLAGILPLKFFFLEIENSLRLVILSQMSRCFFFKKVLCTDFYLHVLYTL